MYQQPMTTMQQPMTTMQPVQQYQAMQPMTMMPTGQAQSMMAGSTIAPSYAPAPSIVPMTSQQMYGNPHPHAHSAYSAYAQMDPYSYGGGMNGVYGSQGMYGAQGYGYDNSYGGYGGAGGYHGQSGYGMGGNTIVAPGHSSHHSSSGHHHVSHFPTGSSSQHGHRIVKMEHDGTVRVFYDGRERFGDVVRRTFGFDPKGFRTIR